MKSDQSGKHTAEHENYLKHALLDMAKARKVKFTFIEGGEKGTIGLSFVIPYQEGYLHHGFVSILLNDLFGIQASAVCLNLEEKEEWQEIIESEICSMIPGYTLVEFEENLDQESFAYLMSAIKFITVFGHDFLGEYRISCVEGTWYPKSRQSERASQYDVLHAKCLPLYKKYIDSAYKKREGRSSVQKNAVLFGKDYYPELAWFYYVQD